MMLQIRLLAGRSRACIRLPFSCSESVDRKKSGPFIKSLYARRMKSTFWGITYQSSFLHDRINFRILELSLRRFVDSNDYQFITLYIILQMYAVFARNQYTYTNPICQYYLRFDPRPYSMSSVLMKRKRQTVPVHHRYWKAEIPPSVVLN